MLILTRHVGDRVRITLPDGRHMWVVYLADHFGKIRLGFDAPKDVIIVREEVLKRKEGTDNASDV